jgi:Cupin-like domain
MSAPEPLVWFDREVFRRSFNQQPFQVEHGLAGHPLFELERLIELSNELPAALVEYNAGDLPVTHDPRQTPRTGLSVIETIRRIEECRSWMVLKNVERSAEYRQLAERCLEPMRSLCPELRGFEAFVFISSPDAVTPYHIDPECNFLLQIRGTKTIRTFPPQDRSIVGEQELERFYAGGGRNLLELKPESESKARAFLLESGKGVHVPVTAPHWVRNGPLVSISLSVTFRTDASDRREIAYRINHHLRRWRLHPRPVGQSPRVDGIKYALFDLARRLARAVRGTTQCARGPAPARPPLVD